MIVGLEWLLVGLAVITVICLTVCFWTMPKNGEVAGIFGMLALVFEITLIAFGIGISSAKDVVEEHYIDYLKLQVQVAQYDELDMFEQYKVNDNVMTYNLWYEKNKSDLENVWTLKGTSDYAKEFDYIIIGG